MGDNAYRMLIVDSNWEVCSAVVDLARKHKFHSDWIPNPLDIEHRTAMMAYHLVLVTRKHLEHPSLKRQFLWEGKKLQWHRLIVARSRTDDNGTAAFASKIYGWIEWPYDLNVVEHHLSMTIQDLERDRKFRDNVRRIDDTRQMLLRQKQGLEKIHHRLMEAQKALAILTERLEQERRQATLSIAEELRTLIVRINSIAPEDLQAAQFGLEVEEISLCVLQSIIDPESVEADLVARLSLTELRIAGLIRRGWKCRDIARHLGISMSTLQTHRKTMRKKLGIHGRRYNLKHWISTRD